MSTLLLNFTLRRQRFELAVDVELPLSGVTGVFGPSGSGKSTLLRAIAGLEPSASGSIRFCEEYWLTPGPGPEVPAWLRGIGYVFQDARLFPHLDVEGNLRFAQQLAPERAAVDLSSVITVLGLEELLKRKPSELSGGEQQRVAMARALASKPKLLLMDEPFAAADIERKAELLPFIRRVVDTFNVPMIYVSHSLDEMAALTDRMMLLQAGKLVELADTPDLMARLDIKDLSGDREAGAVIEATVSGHHEHFLLSDLIFEGQTLQVPMIAAEVGSRIRLQLHSRDVAIALSPPLGTSIRNCLAAEVVALQQPADSPYADLQLSVGTGVIRARITRASAASLNIMTGDQVYALVKSVSVLTD